MGEAFNYKDTILEQLQNYRSECEEIFSDFYCEAINFCTTYSIEPSIPRIARIQRFRANTPADDPEEYYRRVVFIPFLDHVISSIVDRFNETNQTAMMIRSLVGRDIITKS